MEPIAIVGLALKFPQDATSPETFWNMLVERRCAMTEFPSSRLNVDAFYHPGISQRSTLPLRGGHFIQEDLGAFDASFFSITPTEAAAMDPAQRGLLETAYKAFENAGISLNKASGSNTSVHTGCFTDDYKLQMLKDTELIPKYAATGVSLAMLANRLSWFFNLSGQSMNIDSACSSSGIALDHACQLLRNKDCDMSLVAGCNLTFVSDYTSILTKMSFLSPDSRCYTFDHRANGYARGEGIGVVLLKRLSDAIRDRNTLRAVIRSSGSNQDARTPGITQPSSKAQEHLIRETYRKAGLSMEHTRFVEAHGTGTRIGDTVETAAIGNAFRGHRSLEDPLYIGAVKTNIGHLEGASGLAGLIKAVLILETGIIAPNTNFEHINKRIDTEHLKISLPTKCIPWPTDGLRRISVNSFGFGGSNSHIILDDAFDYLRNHKLLGIHCTAHTPPKNLEPELRSKVLNYHQDLSIQGERREAAVGAFRAPKLLVFSASDEKGSTRIAIQYQEHLSKIFKEDVDREAYVNNLAYTLDSCRSTLLWRSHVILDSFSGIDSLADRLSTPVIGKANPPSLGFVFTGQGAQWYAMGRELLGYPVFKSSVEGATTFLGSLGCAWSPIGELTKSEADSNIDKPEYSQALCTVLQVALVELLDSVGIVPAAIIGHSSGEIPAAYCAGAISRESAWKIAYYRGQMAALVPRKSSLRGAMMSVGLSKEDMVPYLSKPEQIPTSFGTTISCFNSNRNVTISGPAPKIDLLKATLDMEGIFARKLLVAVAYHSKQMEHIAEEYLALLSGISSDNSKPSVPMISSVTGLRIDPGELLESDYWVKNLTSPVQFLDAMQRLCLQDRRSLTKKIDRSHRDAVFVDHLIEIGPHAALQAPIRDCLKQMQRGDEIAYSSVLHRNNSAADTFLNLGGSLHALGVPVDLRRINDPFEHSKNTRIALADLPGYPFDHSISYWHESRMSSDYRLRKYGHVELLGSPSPDWNPLDAHWRNVIHSDDVLWAEDHKISGVPLCPGAGMIIMAIEAITQVADPEQIVIGYKLRDIVFEVALDFSPAPAEWETRFALRCLSKTHSQDHPWYSFSVYSLKAGEWTEHCTGTVQLQYESHEELGKTQHLESIGQYKDLWQSRRRNCTIPIDSNRMYQFLQQRGIEYGPAFRRMKNINSSSNGDIIAEVSLLKELKETEFQFSELQVIHPAMLDAVMHSVFAAQSKGATEEIDTQVPKAVKDMWISREGLNGKADESIAIATSIDAVTPLSMTSSSIALDKSENRLRILIDGLEMSTVAKAPSSMHSVPGDSQVWSKMRSFVDIDVLTNDQILDFLNKGCSSPQPEPVAFYQELRMFLKTVLWRTKAKLQLSSREPPQSHLHRYIEWIDWQLGKESISDLRQLSIQNLDELDRCIRKEGAVGLLFAKVAQHLDGVLQGRTDALRLLFEDDLVKDFYEASSHSSMCFAKLQKYLAAFALKRPNMRILEVGAGTGVFTRIVLDAFSVRYEGCLQARMFDQYHFTDISPSFFENARTEFSEYEQKMTFSVFDVEKDPAKQEQQEASFDIIIAANVLHIAKNLSSPLATLRKLLRPRGKLILHETTTPADITTGFVFGLLQDWWVSAEPNRRMGPLTTEHDWHLLLKESGFSGVDIVLRDFEDKACHQSSILVSTNLDGSNVSPTLPSTMINIDGSSHVQQHLAQKLQERLHKDYECEASISSIQEVSQHRSERAVQLFFLDVEEPILPELDPSMFSNLQSSLRHTNQVLWTTSGGGQSPANPGFGMIDGFARALRLERNELKFVTLALDSAIKDVDRKVDHVVQVMCQSFSAAAETIYEREYIEIMGALHLRRLAPADRLKADMLERLHGRQVRVQRLDECKPFELKVPSPGQVDTVEFAAKSDSTTEDLGQDEIEVDVIAVGLDTGDSMQALGLTEQISLGSECAGIVRRIRADNSSTIQIGDRVCMLGTSLCQSYARARQDVVALIPEDMTFVQACALPFRSWLASYVINEVARLKKGESVLIHDGASVLGQLTVHFAQEANALVHTTAHSEADRCMLSERFAIPEDRIYLSNAILSRHSDKGFEKRFDAALSVSEDKDYTDIFKSLRPFGRLIILTGTSNRSADGEVLPDLRSNITISVVNPTSLAQAYISHVHRPLQSIIDQVGRRLSGLQSIKPYSMSLVAEALRQLKDLDRDTRIVVRMDKDDKLSLTRAVTPEYYFDSDSTYLIAGGLGGLGRCIARWMVSRGALNLILLSRSGPRTPAAHEMLSEMVAQGVRVEAPSCDAADFTALQMTMTECSKILPPVKGCIQASGTIQDTWFEEMFFQDWTAVTRPKVQASWNLHSVLPKAMDFFILTASISGIFGQITQVNYASGNAYQDSLAKYRIGQGEKAASLDLGLLLIDGLLKDKPDLVERLNSTGYFIPLSQPEIIAIFDYYCNPGLELSSLEDAQPIVGIQSPSVLRAQGIELPQSMQEPLWYQMVCSGDDSLSATESGDQNQDLATMVSSADSTVEAGIFVTEAIMKKVAQILTMPLEKLDADRRIHHYGVDSLTAVDIRNWISKTFAVPFSTFEILGETSFTDLGLSVSKKCKEAQV